jgi:hypothetical protein
MTSKPELKAGDHVIFIDERYKKHNALVTQVHGDVAEWTSEKFSGPERHWYIPCINLLFVAADEHRTDQYGRQIERPSSVVHKSNNSAGGNCFVFPGEEE